MSRKSSVLILFCIALAFAEPRSAITGTISDSTGAVIPGARVLVHWDSWGGGGGQDPGKNDVIVVADPAGRYSTAVPPGFYDVFVSAPGFAPTAAKVWVREGRETAFHAKLGLDTQEVKYVQSHQ